MIRIRESFGAKLFAALLGTVGLLLVVTFVVVRVQTARVVERVVDRTTRSADRLFMELNDLQDRQAAQLALPFTDGMRARALLDEAIRVSDYEYLADQVDYQMVLQELEDVLLAFTDDRGEPVLTMVHGERIVDADPADIVPMASALLHGDADTNETRGYRVVDGRLYGVRSLYIDLAFRPIGTITFGLPILPEDVERIGATGEFEACFFVGGRCVVQTPGVDDELAAAISEAVATFGSVRTGAGGAEYLIQSVPLIADSPNQGMRVTAVPLDPVVEPFNAIQRALLFGGGGALFLSGLLGAAMSRSLTRPIRDLVDAAGRVAEGDYEAEVGVQSRDEMGTLARAFNDMTHGLLLREQYRAVLDKVVSQDVAEELLKGDVELGGENREVSVIFADIRGFTPMTEGMEPQEVIGLLNECMERLSQAVDAEGGVVDKFIGDEIMAVFGAPVAQADHAVRAVRAGLKMRAGIEEMNRARSKRGLQPLGVGIGVSSGLAVAGNMGSTDRLNYTVLGETVNLAARVVDRAKPGELLISEETYRQVGDAFVASCLTGMALKGFSAGQNVYVVQGAQAPAA